MPERNSALDISTFLLGIVRVPELHSPVTGVRERLIKLSGDNFHDVLKLFPVDDDVAAISRNNPIAIEFIEVFRHLLALGADETGKQLVTESQLDGNAARISGAETISQIQKLEGKAPPHIGTDASDAMNVGSSKRLKHRDMSPKKRLVGSKRKYFNERFWFNAAWRTLRTLRT